MKFAQNLSSKAETLEAQLIPNYLEKNDYWSPWESLRCNTLTWLDVHVVFRLTQGNVSSQAVQQEKTLPMKRTSPV